MRLIKNSPIAVVLASMVLLLSACATTGKLPESEKRLSPAELNVRAAEELLRDGNTQLALQKVLQAVELDPELPSAYQMAGRIYEQANQPTLAEKYYHRASQLAPDSVAIRIDYGKLLCKQGQHRSGEEQFLKGAQGGDARAKAIAYTNAGLCALRIPDPDGAAQYFRAALEYQPELAVAYYQLARINYNKERYPQAHRYIESYFSYGEPTPKVLLLGMRTSRAVGDRTGFDRYADILQTQFPESQEATLAFQLQTVAQKQGWTPSPTPVSAPARAPRPSPESSRTLLGEDWVLGQDSGHFTIQLFRGRDIQALTDARNRLHLSGPFAYFRSTWEGTTWYTLIYGNYPDRSAAEAAFETLPEQFRQKGALVRPFASIQRTILGTT